MNYEVRSEIFSNFFFQMCVMYVAFQLLKNRRICVNIDFFIDSQLALLSLKLYFFQDSTSKTIYCFIL